MNESTGWADPARSGPASTGLLAETAALDQDLRARITAVAQAETEDTEQFRSSSPIIAELAVWAGLALLIFVAVRLWV